MSLKPLDSSFLFQNCLGILLDAQNKYIEVSENDNTLSAVESAENQEQKLLFEKVIEKLTNTTGYMLYKTADSMEAKAEIITSVFLNNCRNSNCTKELEDLYRITLANFLRYHIQTYFESPSFQINETKISKCRIRHLSIPIPPNLATEEPRLRRSSDSSPKKSQSYPILTPQSNRLPEREPKAPEFVAKCLSEDGLSYCYYYWLFQHTKAVNYQTVRDVCEKKITFSDRFHLSENHFLETLDLKVLLEEQTGRVLTEAEKNTELSEDLYRMFEYVAVWDALEVDLYSFNKGEDHIEKNRLLEFGRFLLVVIKKLENNEKLTSHPIVESWKEGIPKSNKKITNQSFAELGKKLLIDLEKFSSVQEKETKQKLKKLLCTLNQRVYTVPSFAIIASLPGMKCEDNINNRSHKLEFLSPSKVEIHSLNTIKFSEGENTDFIHLEIENKLTADLSSPSPWTSEISIRVLPSSKAKIEEIKEFVVQPLNQLGIDVDMSKFPGLRKKTKNLNFTLASSSSKF